MGKWCVIFGLSLPKLALNAHKLTFLCKSAHKLTTDFDRINRICGICFSHSLRRSESQQGRGLRGGVLIYDRLFSIYWWAGESLGEIEMGYFG